MSNVNYISAQEQSINEQNKNIDTSGEKAAQKSPKKLPKTSEPTFNTFSATSTEAISQEDETPVTTQSRNSALTAKQQLNAGQVTGQNKINQPSDEMQKPAQKLAMEQVIVRSEPKEQDIARSEPKEQDTLRSEPKEQDTVRSSPKEPDMARRVPKEQVSVRREQPKEPEVARRAPKESENKRSPPKDPETARREAREQEILRRAPPAKRSVQNQGQFNCCLIL